MNTSKLAAFACVTWLIAGCETLDSTSAVLSNEYPPASEPTSVGSMPVYKGWWSVSQFPDPVAAGQVSDPVRIVLGTDYAYALLAPGWDVASPSVPTTLIPVRSAQKLSVGRGDVLTFSVSPRATVGDCETGTALAQEEADYITQRIFPGEFAHLVYDAKSCTASPLIDGEGGAGGELGNR